jgi:hypothetical protein
MPGSTRRGMAVLAFVLPAFLMLGRCTTSGSKRSQRGGSTHNPGLLDSLCESEPNDSGCLMRDAVGSYFDLAHLNVSPPKRPA